MVSGSACLTVRQQGTVYREELAELMREMTAKKSYRQLARDAGTSPATIGNMVLGRVPSRDMAVAVAKAGGVPIREMLAACGYEAEDPVERVEFALEGIDHLEDWQAEAMVRLIEQRRKHREKNGESKD